MEPDPSREILAGRKRQLYQRIDALIGELRRRKALSNGAVREIERELARLRDALHQLTPLGRRSTAYLEHIERLELSMRHLRELKRQHRKEAWRDMFEVRREILRLLPELQEVLALERVVCVDDHERQD